MVTKLARLELFVKTSSASKNLLVKTKTFKFNTDTVTKISKRYAVAVEHYDRVINISKEYLYNVRILDMKKRSAIREHSNCFRGQHVFGVYSTKYLDENVKGDFNGFIAVYRRNQGVFFMVFNIDNMTSYQYIMDIDGINVI